MYYRVAIQMGPSSSWQWKSTALSSLDALFQWLRLYRALPRDHLRIFSCSLREEMDEQLVRENQGLESASIRAAQFLQERMLTLPELERNTSVQDSGGNEQKTSIAVVAAPLPGESSRGVEVSAERGINILEKRRRELERGAGGDHDVPYQFALPTSMPQVLAWMKLLTRVRHGDLQP